MSYDGDIQPDGACAMAESLIATALWLKAVASGGRAKDGVDADASTLQPQDKQTAAPVRRYAASSRSPQHIGQVLPNTFMLGVALQNSNRASTYRPDRSLCCVRLVTTFSPAAEGPAVTADRAAISSSAATAYTTIAMGDGDSRLPL